MKLLPQICHIFLLFLFIQSISTAQVTFSKRYHFGITRSSLITGLVVTDSCYYATGVVTDTLYPQTRVGNLFCKFDLDGEVEWIKTFTDTAFSIESWDLPLISNMDGGFTTGGYAIMNNGTQKIIFIKYNPFGDTVFIKKHDSLFPSNGGIPEEMTQTPDGGYAIVIWAKDNAANHEIELMKLNKEGDLMWQKNYYHLLQERPESVINTPDGGFIIGGARKRPGSFNNSPDNKTYLIKTDSIGVLQWDHLSPTGRIQDAANGLVLETDGSLIVATGLGTEFPINVAHSYIGWQGLVYKLDTNRQVVWEREILGLSVPSPGTYFKRLIAATDGSGYLALGTTHAPNYEEDGYDTFGWLVKISPEGDSLWGRYYHYVVSPAESHEFYDIQPTPDGGYIMGGQATQRYLGAPNHEPLQQTWLVKVDEYGCLVPGCHLPPDAVSKVEVALDFKLYPNPTTDYLNVWLRTPEWKRNGQFRIINAAGQTMQTFKSQGRDDTYMVSLSGYAAGMYWLQYEVNGMVVKSLGFVKE